MGSVSPFLASSSSLHVCILKVGGGGSVMKSLSNVPRCGMPSAVGRPSGSSRLSPGGHLPLRPPEQ